MSKWITDKQESESERRSERANQQIWKLINWSKLVPFTAYAISFQLFLSAECKL